MLFSSSLCNLYTEKCLIFIVAPASLSGCRRQPCYHGGLCYEGRRGDVKCVCRHGFTGPRCRDIVNPCSSHPCLHDGRCVTRKRYLAGRSRRRRRRRKHKKKKKKKGKAKSKTKSAKKNKVKEKGSKKKPAGGDSKKKRQKRKAVEKNTEASAKNVQNKKTDKKSSKKNNNKKKNKKNKKNKKSNKNQKRRHRWRPYRCICAKGFTGDHCQVGLGGCASNPCESGSICKEVIGGKGYACKSVCFLFNVIARVDLSVLQRIEIYY